MLAPFCLALIAIGCVPHTGADQRHAHVEHEDYDEYREQARVLLQTNLAVSSNERFSSPSAAGAANISRHRSDISFTAVGASQQEYELIMDSVRPTIHVRSKVILAFVNMFGLGCLGIDRCYMGQSCAGIVKGLTLGGLGFWTFLDYIGILVTCLLKDDNIDFLGYKSEFTESSIRPAFWITMALLIFMCFCGGGGTLFYRGHMSRKRHADSKPSKPPRVTRKMRQKLAQQGAVPAGSDQDPALLAKVKDEDEDGEEDGEDEDNKTGSETGSTAGPSRQEQRQHPAEQLRKEALLAETENVEGNDQKYEAEGDAAAGPSRQKQDQYPAVLADQQQEGEHEAAEEEAKRLAAEEEKRKAAEEQEDRRKASQEDNEDASSDSLDFDLYKKVEKRK